MDRNKVLREEIFESIDIIAKKRIEDTNFTISLTGKVIERIKFSDMYRINYQKEEIRAMSLGGTYDAGDEVVVLIPDKRLDNLKFIMGRTNNRTPTITQSEQGLSDAILKEIQDSLETINDMASDNIISPLEKKTLAIQWRELQNSYGLLLKEAQEYDIDTTKLMEEYTALEEFVVPLLEDMEVSTKVSGQELRNRFGAYYDQDQRIHSLILEAISNQLGYKVEVISTNGTQFLNGNIATTLKAQVFRGKENITENLPDTSFLWEKKLNDGTLDLEWIAENSKKGSEVEITKKDVSGRSTFTCSVEIR